MIPYELAYENLVKDILVNGELKKGRNGQTTSCFGNMLHIDLTQGFPILTGRKLFYKGVLGELAAMLKQPKHIRDFEAQGCNYWKAWAKQDGSINVDYGNKWLNFNGFNQLKDVITKLKTNPDDRRMIVTGWDPSNLSQLDLPCCHYAYQWYVRGEAYLDMLWHQRSVDTMIGLPSDAIFAAAWLISMANEVGLMPGRIHMTLGDTHIYSEHTKNAYEYLNRPKNYVSPSWNLHKEAKANHLDFTPDWITLNDYNPEAILKFELKA